MINGVTLNYWLLMTAVAGAAAIIYHELMKWLFTKIIIIEDEEASEIKIIETDWDAIDAEARETMRLAAIRKRINNLTSEDNLNKKTKITRTKIKKVKSDKDKDKTDKPDEKIKDALAGQTAQQAAGAAPQNDAGSEIPIEEIYVRKNGVIQLQDTVKLREEARDRELKKSAKEFMDWFEEKYKEELPPRKKK